jgi:hypothetical protein
VLRFLQIQVKESSYPLSDGPCLQPEPSPHSLFCLGSLLPHHWLQVSACKACWDFFAAKQSCDSW